MMYYRLQQERPLWSGNSRAGAKSQHEIMLSTAL